MQGEEGNTELWWCLWKYMLISRIFYSFICWRGQLRNLFGDRLSWICCQTNTRQIKIMRTFNVADSPTYQWYFLSLWAISWVSSGKLVPQDKVIRENTNTCQCVPAYVAESQPSDTQSTLGLRHQTLGLPVRKITTIHQHYGIKRVTILWLDKSGLWASSTLQTW